MNTKPAAALAVMLTAAAALAGADTDKTTNKFLVVDEAVEFALEKNPALASLRFELKEAGARTAQAGSLSNPELSLEVENIEGTGFFEDYRSRERSVTLSRTYGMGGKRRKTMRLARYNENLAGWDLKAGKLDVVAGTKSSFYEVLGSQEIVSLNEDLAELTDEMCSAAAARVRAGKVSPLEETKAKANLLNQQLELGRSKRRLKKARLALFAVMGISAPELGVVEGNLEDLPDLPGLESLRKRAANSPDWKRFEDEINLRNADIVLQKAKRFPDIEIGARYRDFKESGEEAYGIEFTFPLKIFDRNKGNIKAARHSLSSTERKQEAEKIKIVKELSIAYQEASTAYDEAAALGKHVVAGAEKVFDATVEGYKLGKFGYLEVLDAQKVLFESRKSYLESLITYHKALAELERLAGGRLPGENKGDSE